MRTFLFTTFMLLTFCLLGQKVIINAVKVSPQLSLYQIGGDTSNLRAISKNKVTFINFWFIPCGPCFAEMNMLHKIYAKYKDNPNVAFLTITFTDSSFVKPLTENKNTTNNDTYDYFKKFAGLDTFTLPVYFIKDVHSKMISFKKGKVGFTGNGEPRPKDQSHFPANIFGFSAYPTTFIFDKEGKTVYNKTGFTKEGERQQQTKIEALINAKL